DAVHQMRLAQTDTAVDEQRVVGSPRIRPDLNCRGSRELIALAFDERIEGEIGIQPASDDTRFRGTSHRTALQRRIAHARTDFDDHVAASVRADQLADARQDLAGDPFQAIAVRGEQTESGTSFDCLQRSNVGIEVPLRKLTLELSESASPQR